MIKFNPELVIEKIIDFAHGDIEIWYVIQNGSRVNPSVIPDMFADFDIIMGCRNPEKFVQNHNWIEFFGDLLLLQLNELSENNVQWPIFLMQFKNGIRIDLQFYPGNGILKYQADSLSKVLLDKNNIFTDIFKPSEESYIVKKPEIKEYITEVNNFWWCIINTGKGIARNELTYSRYMYESIVRENFLQIMSWYISSKNGWNINTGKFGKFLSKFAGAELWTKIEKTYYTDSPNKFWESIFEACNLITSVDKELRKTLQIVTVPEDTNSILLFLTKIRSSNQCT